MRHVTLGDPGRELVAGAQRHRPRACAVAVTCACVTTDATTTTTAGKSIGGATGTAAAHEGGADKRRGSDNANTQGD
jgi:hypothetical protein